MTLRGYLYSFFLWGVLLAPCDGIACERDSGLRLQQVFLRWGERPLKNWTAVATEIESIDLPNGVRLGVKIEPADAEKYSMLALSSPHVPELVKITLFDLGSDEPRAISTTWGGSNSIQKYAANGGTDQVALLGAPGVEMILLKPLCAMESGKPRVDSPTIQSSGPLTDSTDSGELPR